MTLLLETELSEKSRPRESAAESKAKEKTMSKNDRTFFEGSAAYDRRRKLKQSVFFNLFRTAAAINVLA